MGTHRSTRVLARRRPRAAGYRVDVWRSIAVLVTDDPPLEANARLVLAASVSYVLSNHRTDRPRVAFPEMPAEQFITTVRDLHANGWLAIEDGRAYPSVPVPDMFGRLVPTRVPQDQMGEFVEALVRGLDG